LAGACPSGDATDTRLAWPPVDIAAVFLVRILQKLKERRLGEVQWELVASCKSYGKGDGDIAPGNPPPPPNTAAIPAEIGGWREEGPRVAVITAVAYAALFDHKNGMYTWAMANGDWNPKIDKIVLYRSIRSFIQYIGDYK
jgi:hypothetical protein